MKFTLLSWTVVFLLNCGATPPPASTVKQETIPVTDTFRYQIEKPDRVYQLPSILNEVSGITDLDSTHVAVVQDERGLVFVYDLVKGQVKHEFAFDSIGDFEGITYADGALYVLRSDGRLTEWAPFNMNDGSGKVVHHTLNLLTKDNEGLCYDKTNQRLLIAAKSKPFDQAKKDARYVYAFDLQSKKLQSPPALTFDINELSEFAKSTGFNTGVTAKGKPKAFNFRPSGLSIHPVTNELYVISASDEIMIIFDANGKPISMTRLDPKLFPKPEGITFLPDNTMLISTEADGKVPAIFRYDLK